MNKAPSMHPWALLVIVPFLGAATPALAQTDSGAPPAADAAAPTPVLSVVPSPTLPRIVRNAFADLKRLPSRDTLLWLSIGAGAAMMGHVEDAGTTRMLSGSVGLREKFQAGAIVGGTPFQMGAAFATYALGRATNSPRVISVGADLVRAQVLAEATTMAVKFSVRRIRPDGSSFSFPSGHTAVTFASATVLQRHFGWRVGIPAYGVASYVAASRIQMKRHYLSDVAFGAALGIVAGRTVTVGRGDARFAVGPMAAPGGGGVSFTWVGKQ